jgi:hypothetical protein
MRSKLATAASRACAALGLGLALAGAAMSACPTRDANAVAEAMRRAWEKVRGYQAEVEVVSRRNGTSHTRRFRYWFAKPESIRIRMQEPYAGTLLIYPNRAGEVTLHPAGPLGLLQLSLQPDSSLLAGPVGQPLHRTDLGEMVANLAASLTSQRRGEVRIEPRPEGVWVEVEAEHHFLSGVPATYRFLLDENRCLPLRLEESTGPDHPDRTVRFHSLELNPGPPGPAFRPEED